MQPPANDSAKCKQRFEPIHRIVRTRYHAQRRSIDRSDRQWWSQQVPHLFFRQPHRQHRTAGQFLHQLAARRDHRQGIFQSQNAGNHRCDELPDAVADHRLRRDSPAHPEPGQ